MSDVTKAIINLRPGAKWSVDGNTYAGITWLDTEQSKPTEAEIAAEMVRLQAEHDANAYKEQRAIEYPSIGDQLDALFHAGVFPAEMAAAIQTVKDKYPKGGA